MENEETKSEPELQEKSLAELLSATPPGGLYSVPNLAHKTDRGLVISVPHLQLHCASDTCSGIRFFDGQADTIYLQNNQNIFMGYQCRNCKGSPKLFALKVLITQVIAEGVYGSHVIKIGELPAFGPPNPARLISLIGPDRDLFLMGRRAENQGLGIGAFGYYRRVVENQKGRLIDEIARAAKRLGADGDTLAKFARAGRETQFSRVIDEIRGAIPQSILIHGQNPLALLHSALSEGLHAQTDEECLALATSIRVVLAELAERISQALKDEAEIRQAVSRLLSKPPAATGAE